MIHKDFSMVFTQFFNISILKPLLLNAPEALCRGALSKNKKIVLWLRKWMEKRQKLFPIIQ